VLEGHKVISSNPREMEELLLPIEEFWEVGGSCSESCETKNAEADIAKNAEADTVAPFTNMDFNLDILGIIAEESEQVVQTEEKNGNTQDKYEPTWDFSENFKMFAANFQVSSMEPLNYQDYLLCCPEEVQLETDPILNCGLGSLQTGTVRYLEGQNVCKSRKDFPYTEQTFKRNIHSKQRHFNPANNNIPDHEYLRLVTERATQPKITNFDAYNCNIPQEILEEVHLRLVTERVTQPKITNFDAYNCNIPNCKHLSLVKEQASQPKITHFDAYNCNIPQEIIEPRVDLSETHLTRKQKKKFLNTLRRYKNVFPLKDEYRSCTSMEVHLELKDCTPYAIRPFPVKEEGQILINKQMRKGCLLEILKKALGAYSSHIMLIPRKLGGIPGIVTDFRPYSRLVWLNPSIPLTRDAIQVLRAAEYDFLSVIDLDLDLDLPP
jgi:hypothetical protein